MKRNTKKKVLSLALVMALLAIALVGGSLAWFSDTDEATNTFTVGSVEIVQYEQQHDENGNLEDFEQEKMLLPVVGTDPAAATDNYQEKIVTVKNTGKNDACVQTFVAVPAELDNAEVLHLWDSNAAANGWTKATFAVPGPTIGGIVYNVYRYRYNTPLAAGSTTDPCLEYVYIDSRADLNAYDNDNNGTSETAHFVMNGTELTGINAFNPLNIYVLSQACQIDGFASADEALEAVFPSSVMPEFNP